MTFRPPRRRIASGTRTVRDCETAVTGLPYSVRINATQFVHQTGKPTHPQPDAPSGEQQRWWTPWRVRMVEYHPGVVMLCGVRALAHVEPADPLLQYQDGRERPR
jgi:hypothetical protein